MYLYRRTMDEDEEGNRQPTQVDQPISKPPDDWEFNHLLWKIAESVPKDSLDIFKSLFMGHGKGSIGKKKLEECDTCQKFFTHLRQTEYISRDNLAYVLKFLYILDNRELIKETIEYCRQNGIIHFYEAPEQPEEPGNTNVKFHVQVRDLRDCSPAYLKAVCDRVADVLCIPREHVAIVGVGPSSSFYITLMIPSTYADILQDMLEAKQSFTQLCELHIDFICIGENVFSITGMEEAEQEDKPRKYEQYFQQSSDNECLTSDQKSKEITVTNMTDQQNNIKRVKEELADIRSKLSKEKQIRKSTENKLYQTEVAYQTLNTMNTSAARCEDEEYLKFCEDLRHAEIPEKLRDSMRNILNSNTMLVSSYTRKLHESEVRSLKNELKQQKENVKDLERQLEVQRYLSYGSVSDVTLLQTFRLYMKEKNLEQFEKDVDIIKAISKELNEAERREIMFDYQWEENNLFKRHIEQSENMFLIGIICKEFKRTTSVAFDIESFICRILNRIRRNDLLKMYTEIAGIMSREVIPLTVMRVASVVNHHLTPYKSTPTFF